MVNRFRHRRRGARPMSRVVVVGGIALSAAAVEGSAVAQEPAEGGCPVVASAQGVQVMITVEDQLLDQPSGVGAPVAQTCVNFGLSDSMGFASNPYPGETVLSLPALVWGPSGLEGATGQSTPAYPGYAASRYPVETKSQSEQPGYSLRAASTETSSKARAYSGLTQDATNVATTVATAESVVDPAALTGTATAASDTQPLTFNEVLELGRVRSNASAAVNAKGTVRRESSLVIGRTTVADQVVQITPRGVEAAGQTVPVAGSDPAEALAEAGIQVRYLAEEKVPNGVLSAGVEVVVKQESKLASGRYYRVHYIIGRAFAAADKVERPVGGVPVGGALPGPVAGGGLGGDAEGAGESGGPAPESASVPEAAESPPAPEAAPQAAPAPQVAAPAGWVGRPIDMGMAGFYLVLVCGAAAMFAGTTLLRLLGVRTRWTS